jgi:hypothetical protein
MFPQASSAISDGETRLVCEPVGVAYGVVGTGLTDEATTAGTYVEAWARAAWDKKVAEVTASKITAARRSANLPQELAATLSDFPLSSGGRRDSSGTFGDNSPRGEAAIGRMEQLRMILNKWSSRRSGHILVSFY